MKKCKKIILLVIVFLLSTISNVYADESLKKAEVTLTPNKTSVKAGETITIVVKASYENKIECVDSILEYDKTKLELEKVEMKNDFDDQSGTDGVTGEYVFTALFSGEEAVTEVEYAELIFKVLEKANVGEELNIKLSNVNIIDTNLETASVGDKEVMLTVIGDKVTEPELKPEPKPEQEIEIKPESKPQQEIEIKPESKPNNLPQTGKNSIASLFIIGIIVSIILYSRIIKYKDIK